MNYTENYHLPQWAENDRIMRKDFNRMCADMETGLNANAAAASAAQTRADQGVSDAAAARTAAGNAQTTADAALTKAGNAYAPDQKPFVVGTYVGKGKTTYIQLGFRPSFIIISGQTTEAEDMHVLMATGDVRNGTLRFYSDSVEIYPAEGYYPQIDLEGRTYHYIAFR